MLRILPWLTTALATGAVGYLGLAQACLWQAGRNIRQIEACPAATANKFQSSASLSKTCALNELEINELFATSESLIRIAERHAGRTADSLYTLGRLRSLRGDDDNAARLLALAAVLRPDDHEVRFHYGMSLANAGRVLDSPELSARGMDELMIASRKPGFPTDRSWELAIVASALPAPRGALRYLRQVEQGSNVPELLRRRAREESAAIENRIQAREGLTRNRFEPSLLTSVSGYLESWIPIAISEWLANPHEHRAGLRAIAEYAAAARFDTWWVDMNSVANKSPDTLASFARAYRLNQAGQYEEARRAAAIARDGFTKIASRAGYIASSVELAVANRRMLKTSECLAALGGISEIARKHRYNWYSLRAINEQFSCETQSRVVDVMEAREAWVQQTTDSGYVDLHLRAIAATIEPFHSYAAPASSWRRGRRALEEFWNSPLTGVVASNLYIPLGFLASAEGLQNVSSLLHEEAAGALLESPNRLLLAQVSLVAGRALLRMNDAARAADYVHRAEQAAPSMEFAVRMVQAQVALSQKDGNAALTILQSSAPGQSFPFQALNRYNRLELLPALGGAWRYQNDLEAAKRHYSVLVSETASYAARLRDQQLRLAVMIEAEASWRGLVDTLYDLGKPEEALETWQKYRSAGTSQPVPAGDMNWISFARVGERYLGWVRNSSGFAFHAFDAETTDRRIAALSRLVADPESSMQWIQILAQELGEHLLGPFKGHLRNGASLVIDADQALGEIPWPILELNGTPIIERHALVIAHGWGEVAQRLSKPNGLGSRPLIVSRPKLSDDAAAQFPMLTAADRESDVLRSMPGRVELTGKVATAPHIIQRLAEADTFHFSGHGFNAGSAGSLVVTPAMDSESFGVLTASQIRQVDLNRLRLAVIASCASAGTQLHSAPNFDNVSRAFLQAGAHRVVASRWNIDSIATAAVMSRFYRLVHDGRPAATALQTAMKAVSKLQDFKHPYYWAGLSLYGAP